MGPNEATKAQNWSKLDTNKNGHDLCPGTTSSYNIRPTGTCMDSAKSDSVNKNTKSKLFFCLNN